MVVMKDSLIIPPSSCEIPWSYHVDKAYYNNVIRTLIIPPISLISTQEVVRYLLKRNILEQSIRNVPKSIYYTMFFSEIQNYQK